MGRQRVPTSHAYQIRGRLVRFIRLYRQQSTARFADAAGLQQATVRKWLRKDDPVTPDVATLLEVARRTNLSLNYLVLGEGPMLREDHTPGDGPADQFRGQVVARLRAMEAITDDVLIDVVPNGEAFLKDVSVHYLAKARRYRTDLADARRRIWEGVRKRVMAGEASQRQRWAPAVELNRTLDDLAREMVLSRRS